MPEVVGEYLDRLCNIEMRMAGLVRGTTHRRYDVARRVQGHPLTYLAASKIIENVHKGDFVLILTGSGSPLWLPWGETDGPLGAACLARAIDLGLQAKSVFISEERFLEPIKKTCVAAGVSVLPKEMVTKRNHAAVFLPFPQGEKGARDRAESLLDEFNPKAVVSVERTGPNEKGVFHTQLGTAKEPDTLAHLHWLVVSAKERNILTIGVGDGGNEIGYGLIKEELKEIGLGSTCRCPCESGLISAVATDVLVSAAVSNWGAYCVAGCIAHLLKSEELLHDAATELRMLEACVSAGAGDGHYGAQILSVDGGIGYECNQAFITMARTLVKLALKEIQREY